VRSLIVEDNFSARQLLQIYLEKYGPCHIAVNGVEAVEAVRNSLETNEPYDLICLDIMMPEMDGQEALKRIRQLEKEAGRVGLDVTKVIMTTAKDQSEDILAAFREGCEAYIVKPVKEDKLKEEMSKLGLLNNADSVS
jgi:two-component system, chemotaxis family, chemotaxis protein CheY